MRGDLVRLRLCQGAAPPLDIREVALRDPEHRRQLGLGAAVMLARCRHWRVVLGQQHDEPVRDGRPRSAGRDRVQVLVDDASRRAVLRRLVTEAREKSVVFAAG